MTDNDSHPDSEHIEPCLYQINNLPVKKKRLDHQDKGQGKSEKVKGKRNGIVQGSGFTVQKLKENLIQGF